MKSRYATVLQVYIAWHQLEPKRVIWAARERKRRHTTQEEEA